MSNMGDVFLIEPERGLAGGADVRIRLLAAAEAVLGVASYFDQQFRGERDTLAPVELQTSP